MNKLASSKTLDLETYIFHLLQILKLRIILNAILKESGKSMGLPLKDIKCRLILSHFYLQGVIFEFKSKMSKIIYK